MFGHQTVLPIWTRFKESNNPGPQKEVNCVCLSVEFVGNDVWTSMAMTILTRFQKKSFGAKTSLEVKAVSLQICLQE